jgi:hypothetical protein
MTFRTTSNRRWSIKWRVQLRPNRAWLSPQHPIGDGASNHGCNSGPTGHDFQDDFNTYFLFFIIRTGHFPKYENRSGFQIGCQVRTWAVSTGRFSLGVRTFNPVLTGNRDENRRRFSANRWEPPNTGNDPMQRFHLHFIQFTTEGMLWALDAPNDFLTLGCLDEQIS